jgi:hypothetical protein
VLEVFNVSDADVAHIDYRYRGQQRDLSRPLASWLNGALVLVSLVGIVWLERKRPLRGRIEDETNHDARNLTMSVLSTTAIRITEKPLMDRLTHAVQRNGWGLLQGMRLRRGLELISLAT